MADEMRGPKDNGGETQPQRSDHRDNMPWLGGVVLIAVGVVFLLRQVSGFRLDNWWALFILIPAVGSFSTAWKAYNNAERKFTASVRGPLIGGFVMILVASIFLFNLDWSLFFPAILILTGLGLLANSLMK